MKKNNNYFINSNAIWDIDIYSFENLCEKLFHLHYYNNKIYQQFCNYINKIPGKVASIEKIPFLPVGFFKSHVINIKEKYDLVFQSSGTTGTERSKHYIFDKNIYENSFLKSFNLFFGEPSQYAILGLLPSYSEHPNSSLIYMVQNLMNKSKNKDNGFYVYNIAKLAEDIEKLQNFNQKVILFGVSFALLDFAEQYKINFPELIIIETGGMKGGRKEITREELYKTIMDSTGVKQVYSEYGMTELCSQAYAKKNGMFQTPPWMKILIRDSNDPFAYLETNKIGGLNIIDLANIYSCPFIATDDLGKINAEGSFEVLGRLDYSEIRGCSTMI